jgi:unsaturated rhamnogalacturonyl hydrolase
MKKLHILTATILLTALMFISCTSTVRNTTDEKSVKQESYSVLMGETLMKEWPNLWTIEGPRINWTYTLGLISSAMLDLYEYTDDPKYLNYVEYFADSAVTDLGQIRTYKMSEYNIDKINSGKMLLRLYQITGKEKFRIAADTLRRQLEGHPKTEIGGFWHKKRYPHQMWLDGLYMGGPFFAQYTHFYGDPGDFDQIILWFENMEKVARDPGTGLLYHGWDESGQQKWADPQTGQSPNFWGRGMGWYGMALVDVLDFIPKSRSCRDSLIAIINRMAEAIVKVQDPGSGVWYQVLDQGGREGNFLEGSASAMLSYFLLKAINKGYIDREVYEEPARNAYEGMIRTLVTKKEDGTIVISPVCQVAGLGGNPYRDGSYEYYIHEKQRDNDPKATGPFIMAGIEYEKLTK